MTELTPTPGPWAAKKLSGSYAQPGWVVLWPDTSKPGVHMRRIDWQGQFTEADAKLIAAAPELLEALRFLLGVQGADELSDVALEMKADEGDAYYAAVLRSRAAIAKATGAAA